MLNVDNAQNFPELGKHKSSIQYIENASQDVAQKTLTSFQGLIDLRVAK